MNYTNFVFNDTPTPDIYTLSLHDALPIFRSQFRARIATARRDVTNLESRLASLLLSYIQQYAPSSRLACRARSEEYTSNSSHQIISYAVFCLKKKKNVYESTAQDRNPSRR